MKWGPTSANCSPARIVFIRTAEGKERLRPALSSGNLQKTLTAPVTAIVACRALGLDTGPMSGFDRQYVDDAFFAGSTLKSNLLINIGYGDSSKLFARLPRLSFEEACGLL